MAGVQLLTAQGQALETGQHLPEEARFREALVERQPHGPHADPDPHADLEQLQADRAAFRLVRLRAAGVTAALGPASPIDRLLKRMETGRGGCCNPSPASVSDQVHQTSYPYEEAFKQDTGGCNRESTRYQRMATYVSRLAEALGRAGRFAQRDKVLDVAIALEGMYELPKRKKSRTLQERASSYIGTDTEDQQRIKESIRIFYEARSDIVHSGSGQSSPFRNDAAFVTGFDLARRSLFKLLREGPPCDWEFPADTRK